MRKVMAVVMVLACSTAWGQSDPLAPAGGFAGGTVLASGEWDVEAIATGHRTMASDQWTAASALIQQWNPNVGDYTAMANIVLEAPNPDPMLAMMVWMLLNDIRDDVAEMWALAGEAIALREQSHVEYLIGDSYYADELWLSADTWFQRSLVKSSMASANMQQSMQLRMQVLEQIAILLDMVGP